MLQNPAINLRRVRIEESLSSMPCRYCYRIQVNHKKRTCNKTDRKSLWVADKKNRCGYNKAAVAVANKNARIIWAILATGECYRKPASPKGLLA